MNNHCFSFYQVDAFSDRVFSGNPAVVVPLSQWLDDQLLQQIAQEHHVSETAFFVRQSPGVYQLRWFTPEVEVNLCGHATLASAYVLFELLGETAPVLRLETLSGTLQVSKQNQLFELGLPSLISSATTIDQSLALAMGQPHLEQLQSREDYLLVYDKPETVIQLQPDFSALRKHVARGIIATAPAEESDLPFDFISRFFAPNVGIDEDPVTGSAHCVLTPFWSERLKRSTLKAFQASSRGGTLICEQQACQVKLKGNAVLFSKGEFYLS